MLEMLQSHMSFIQESQKLTEKNGMSIPEQLPALVEFRVCVCVNVYDAADVWLSVLVRVFLGVK